MITRRFIEVKFTYGAMSYMRELATGNHVDNHLRLPMQISNLGPYKDEILVNGQVLEGEELWNYVLQDGDVIEGRITKTGRAEHAAQVQAEEDRLKNRSIKEKIFDGIESFIEAIFNPFGY